MFNWFKKRDFVIRIIQSLKMNKDWKTESDKNVVKITHTKCGIEIILSFKSNWILVYSNNTRLKMTFIEERAVYKVLKSLKRQLKLKQTMKTEKEQKAALQCILECKDL